MDNGVGYHRILNDPRISIFATQFKISMIHEQVELKSPARKIFLFILKFWNMRFLCSCMTME